MNWKLWSGILNSTCRVDRWYEQLNIVVLKNNIIQCLQIHALMTVSAWTIHLMLNEGEGTDMEVSQVVVDIYFSSYLCHFSSLLFTIFD